jgi:hypothetical protein
MVFVGLGMVRRRFPAWRWPTFVLLIGEYQPGAFSDPEGVGFFSSVPRHSHLDQQQGIGGK